MSSKKTIDALLNSAHVAIANSLTNAQIQSYLSEFGYTPERIQQGKLLYEAALAAHQQQRAEYGDQRTATTTLKQAWDTAKKSYMRYVKIARIVFKDNAGVSTRLELEGDRKKTLSGWLAQANQFYTNLLNAPELLTQLREYGITADKLQAGQAEVQAVDAANLSQKTEKGDAQTATQTKEKAIAALQSWMSDFTGIARLALEGDRQLLEGLGIVVKSRTSGSIEKPSA
ncbi:MAG: hypothetical protein HC899_36935 [Leptolyngbyaceae cyanobacterium SM1_4_3]|nr:hypothetical protein [Leptolyngbyaceae cyanobacterium SM1_4_3]